MAAGKADMVVTARMKDLLSKAYKKTGRNVRQETKRMDSALTTVKNTVFSLQGAIAGIGAAMVIRKVFALGQSFIRTAADAENMKISLTSLLGTVEEANALFADLGKYASTVPHELKDIRSAAVALSGSMDGGRKEIMKWMPLIGDLAAVTKGMGIDFQTASMQIQRMYSSGAASADVFRERGVLAMMGFTKGVSYSLKQTRDMLMAAWEGPESKFKGAAAAMADSWDGKMSMIADVWEQFKLDIMDSGIFDGLKVMLDGLLGGMKAVMGEIVKVAKEAGEEMDWRELAIDVSITVLEALGSIIKAYSAVKKQIEPIVLVFRGLRTSIDFATASLKSANPWMNQFATATKSSNSAIEDAIAGLRKLKEGLDDTTKGRFFDIANVTEMRAKAALASVQKGVAGLGGKVGDAPWVSTAAQVEVDFDFSQQSFNDAMHKLREMARKAPATEVKIKGEYPAWYKALLADAPKSVEDTNAALKEQVAIWDDIAGKEAEAKRKMEEMKGVGRDLISIGGQFVTQVLDAMLDKTEQWEHTLAKAAIHLAVQVGTTMLKAAVAAKGAVWEGGFAPIHAFAGGGMVQARSPVMGIIGEGQRDEAIIPMENGAVRAVIDSPKGGGGTVINNYYTIQGDVLDPEEYFMRNRDSIGAASAANREENPRG